MQHTVEGEENIPMDTVTNFDEVHIAILQKDTPNKGIHCLDPVN